MSDSLVLLLVGLLLGAVMMFMFWRLRSSGKKAVIRESSHTVLESVRKVFKVVLAEGFFNELYNYEETRKVLGFLPSTKRALVIIQAKVMVGFDFEKSVWEVDEESQKVTLVSFPEPEIFSIETDYKYYNFDEGIFNLLNREDLSRIQINGKKQVEAAALKSDLPKMAAEQMRAMLAEVMQSKNWRLENLLKVSAGDGRTLQQNQSRTRVDHNRQG